MPGRTISTSRSSAPSTRRLVCRCRRKSHETPRFEVAAMHPIVGRVTNRRFGAMSLDEATDLVKHQTPTRDAFLGGRLIVSQPAKGFRAGLDLVLLGAAVNSASSRLLDLAPASAPPRWWRCADLPEPRRNPGRGRSRRCWRWRALNLAGNGFGERAKMVGVDLTAPGKVRAAAGLAADHFSTVIANPPFFDPGKRSAPPARPRRCPSYGRGGHRPLGEDGRHPRRARRRGDLHPCR